MSLRVALHHGHDGDPGWEAWALDYTGLATYAGSRDEVLDKLPSKTEEHLLWREIHALDGSRLPGGIDVVEEVSGNEPLFEADRHAASPEEIAETIALLGHTRAELLSIVAELPDEVLDWDPPYRRFASWATWRTIRQTLAHIQNSETHYYCRNVGVRPTMSPADPTDDWRVYMARGRTHTIAGLNVIRSSNDRARVTEAEEGWSVRKALRRLVRHEIQHTRSIRRIVRAFDARDREPADD